MAKIRQKNVTAAQWSPNGAALGALDLTQPANNPFGANVFSLSVQRQRLPRDVFRKLQRTLERVEAIDPSLADGVAGALGWLMDADDVAALDAAALPGVRSIGNRFWQHG